jgi:hypothetical protein
MKYEFFKDVALRHWVRVTTAADGSRVEEFLPFENALGHYTTLSASRSNCPDYVVPTEGDWQPRPRGRLISDALITSARVDSPTVRPSTKPLEVGPCPGCGAPYEPVCSWCRRKRVFYADVS